MQTESLVCEGQPSVSIYSGTPLMRTTEEQSLYTYQKYRGVRISEASMHACSVFSVGVAMRTRAVGRVPELSLAVHLREKASPKILGLPPPFYSHSLYTPSVYVIAKF